MGGGATPYIRRSSDTRRHSALFLFFVFFSGGAVYVMNGVFPNANYSLDLNGEVPMVEEGWGAGGGRVL